MKTPRNSSSHSGAANSSPRDKRRTESVPRSKTKATPSDASQQPNSKIRDLPPNENIRKRADEVYGDTEISERKPGT